MTKASSDIYQDRYLKHQERKTKMLSEGEGHGFASYEKEFFRDIIEERVSQRIFNKEKITKEELDYIKKVIVNTPSSCNRQPIKIMVIKDKNRKEELEELLVGGSKWISKADIILLLITDMKAYKSPAEVEFMPYLDAGFIGMSVYYACESLGVGCCFVNPNVRDFNKERFENITKDKLCGAIALGHYDKKAISIKKSNKIFI